MNEIDEIRKQAIVALCKKDLLSFTVFTKGDYDINWHHEIIAQKLTDLSSGKIKKLMLFLPPQTGKSELSSRRFPAWVLGNNPNTKIALASYSATKAEEFSLDIQRIMRSESFHKVFPDISLPDNSMPNKDKRKNTNEYFEIMSFGKEMYSGFLKAVGVTGPLTGTPVDLGIIDDPIKDDLEADSEKYRERLWNWYVKVFCTRLHNDSKVLLTMTRWHEDDLAARILESEPNEWEVVIFPAICENEDNEFDPRKIGEALWEKRHSRERILKIKGTSPRTYYSMYQQRPTPEEGEIWHKDWFQIIEASQLPSGMMLDLWVDGAFTEKVKNDPTGVDVIGYHGGNMYIVFSESKHMELPKLLEYVPDLCEKYDIGRKSLIWIEPKASGQSLRQMLMKKTKLNCVYVKRKWVQAGKIERAKSSAPTIEAGRVFLVKGKWNEAYLTEVSTFPNGRNDEHVDNTSYAIYRHFLWKRKKGIRTVA